MSDWIIPKKGDIKLVEDGKELHIWFESDDFGNRYISLEGEALEHTKALSDLTTNLSALIEQEK